MLPGRRKLTDEQARAARFAFADGVPAKQIQDSLGISHPAFYNLIRGQTYKTAGGPVSTALERMARREAEQLRVLIQRLTHQIETFEMRIDDLSIDDPMLFADRRMRRSDRRLLGVLMRWPGRVVTVDTLRAASGCEAASIKVAMTHLRQACPEIEVTAEPGFGYRAVWREPRA